MGGTEEWTRRNGRDRRRALDRLVAQMADPVFVRHRRVPSGREQTGIPARPCWRCRSALARRSWRRRLPLPACAATFRYLGLSLG
jgi:hypothetical protein